MKKILLSVLCLAVFTCCEKKVGGDSAEKNVVVEEEMAEADSTTFGVAVNLTEVKTLAVLETEMSEKDSLEEVTVAGKVQAVCQKKGCWMTLEKENGETMRITFKDYALFMPKDLAGKEVVVHGVAKKSTTSVETLRHFAEDAGKSKEEIEKITEAETSIVFEADGVKIKS
ncbi:MAG: hypothetical protein ACI85I_001317 [Arenicella sp.]|jgi:hypothetical protein